MFRTTDSGVTATMPAELDRTLAIVVGTLNRLGQLQDLVRSVRRHVRTPWELHISDAGSTDGTRAWLTAEADRDARLRPTLESRRTGQAPALNAVFGDVATSSVCWLSDDNVLVGDGLDVAVAALHEDQQLGMVGLKVKDKRGPFASASYIGGITSTGVLNINQGVLRTSVLRALGGFDADFVDYGMDADLTTRVLLAGYDVALTRDVTVAHYRNWPESGSKAAVRLEGRNAAYRARYGAKYTAVMDRRLTWLLRRAVWKVLRTLAPRRLAPAGGHTILGRSVRDWNNLATCQFLDLRRELSDDTSPLYLRQSLGR